MDLLNNVLSYFLVYQCTCTDDILCHVRGVDNISENRAIHFNILLPFLIVV